MTNTLDERDRTVLEALFRERADESALAERLDGDPDALAERLAALAGNGLIERAAGGAYTLSDSGRRILLASPTGALDDRIDTPSADEEAIESWDLRADRADAVRAALAFLRYWGEATESEIVDAVYSEYPAGHASAADWWDDLRDRLAALPSVASPEAPDERWRFEGQPVIEQPTTDGRAVLGPAATAHSSARFAIESLDLDRDERAAVRAAFARLVADGAVAERTLREDVYPDHAAGYASPEEWWTGCVEPAFERIPGVVRGGTGETTAGDADEAEVSWEYRQSDGGSAASGTDIDR